MALLAQARSKYEKSMHAWRSLIDPQNQAMVEADLSAFFGPKSEVYLRHYRRMVEKGRLGLISWHWPFLFTGGFGWALYRRQWGWGVAILLVLIVIIALNVANPHFPGVDVVTVVFAMQAKHMYVQVGFGHILSADKLGLVGEARRSLLQKKGGISRVAGVLAGPWFALFIIAGFATALSDLDGQRNTEVTRSDSVDGPDLRN